jgi:hypothetical protein
MTLIAAAVRRAIALEPKQAARMLALFKRMLPKNLAASECDSYRSNIAAQAGLKLPFCRRRQAVMARTLGISPAHSR